MIHSHDTKENDEPMGCPFCGQTVEPKNDRGYLYLECSGCSEIWQPQEA